MRGCSSHIGRIEAVDFGLVPLKKGMFLARPISQALGPHGGYPCIRCFLFCMAWSAISETPLKISILLSSSSCNAGQKWDLKTRCDLSVKCSSIVQI
jgi:hypothetical protein